jgi:hypothetical protein
VAGVRVSAGSSTLAGVVAAAPNGAALSRSSVLRFLLDPDSRFNRDQRETKFSGSFIPRSLLHRRTEPAPAMSLAHGGA